MANPHILLIDTTCLFDQYAHRGIGRYAKEVLKRIIKLVIDEPDWKIALVGFETLQKNLIEIGLSTFTIEEIQPYIEFHSLGKPLVSSYKNVFRWKKTFGQIIDAVEPTVYYAMHFERGLPTTNWIGLKNYKGKTVVAAHDLIPKIFNTFSQKGPIHNWIKKTFYNFMWSGVQKADLVFVPSEISKQDIVKFGHVNPDTVKKIYLGIDDSFYKETYTFTEKQAEDTLHRLQIDNQYFFYDSGLESNKGSRILLQILARLYEQKNDAIPPYLVLTGGGSLTQGKGQSIKSRSENGKQFLDLAQKLGILDRIISTYKLDEEDLRIVLSRSKLYIYLSQYEGFGFGPVQAMAAEIPTIVANTSCLPEITAGGSLLIDTENIDDSVNKIIQLSQSESAQKELIEKGKVVVQRYNWDDTVGKTWEGIKDVVGSKL